MTFESYTRALTVQDLLCTAFPLTWLDLYIFGDVCVWWPVAQRWEYSHSQEDLLAFLHAQVLKNWHWKNHRDSIAGLDCDIYVRNKDGWHVDPECVDCDSGHGDVLVTIHCHKQLIKSPSAEKIANFIIASFFPWFKFSFSLSLSLHSPLSSALWRINRHHSWVYNFFGSYMRWPPSYRVTQQRVEGDWMWTEEFCSFHQPNIFSIPCP